jgi:hypothetical protein
MPGQDAQRLADTLVDRAGTLERVAIANQQVGDALIRGDDVAARAAAKRASEAKAEAEKLTSLVDALELKVALERKCELEESLRQGRADSVAAHEAHAKAQRTSREAAAALDVAVRAENLARQESLNCGMRIARRSDALQRFTEENSSALAQAEKRFVLQEVS